MSVVGVCVCVPFKALTCLQAQPIQNSREAARHARDVARPRMEWSRDFWRAGTTIETASSRRSRASHHYNKDHVWLYALLIDRRR